MPSIKCLADRLKEVDAAVGAAKSKKAKVEALKSHSHPDFKDVFGLAFNPAIKFALPEGAPPFKTTANGIDSENILNSVIKRKKLAIYMRGQGYDNMAAVQRESKFMNLLSELHPEDAVLLCYIKDKKLPYPNITIELVKEAFPILTKDW